MKAKQDVPIRYARKWPREIFDREQAFARRFEILDNPGVYVLYRDDVPHYIGQASVLRSRIRRHATLAGSRYYPLWNYFSVFVRKDPSRRREIEAILIAAIAPTLNGANPKLAREPLPNDVARLLRR